MMTLARFALTTAVILHVPLQVSDRLKVPVPTATPSLPAKLGRAGAEAKLHVPALFQIDAVGFASGFAPCQGLVGAGYVSTLGGADLMRTNDYTVTYCAVGWVRAKKTTPVAFKGPLTLLVTADHFNITPWQKITSVYQLQFPATGDTLTFPKVAIGSYPGDNKQPDAWKTNPHRMESATFAYSHGQPVVLELKSGNDSLDKKSCTFKSSATFTCP